MVQKTNIKISLCIKPYTYSKKQGHCWSGTRQTGRLCGWDTTLSEAHQQVALSPEAIQRGSCYGFWAQCTHDAVIRGQDSGRVESREEGRGTDNSPIVLECT